MRGDPEDLHGTIMTTETYDILMSEIRVYLEDQDRKVPARSHKGNSDCIMALLDVAYRLLPREEFRRLYSVCMEW